MSTDTPGGYLATSDRTSWQPRNPTAHAPHDHRCGAQLTGRQGPGVRHDGRPAHRQASPHPRGPALLLLLGRVPREVHRRARALSEARRAAAPPAGPAGTIYTCPMHPEIRQPGPGSCPICGMALEPEIAYRPRRRPNPELADMTRRFWIGLALTVPVFALEMGGHLTNLHQWIGQQTSNWIQLAAGDARRAVGRMAVLRARLDVRSRRAISTCSR